MHWRCCCAFSPRAMAVRSPRLGERTDEAIELLGGNGGRRFTAGR
jgi:hypothetical protein